MTPNPPRKNWFFPVTEAPVHATVTHDGMGTARAPACRFRRPRRNPAPQSSDSHRRAITFRPSAGVPMATRGGACAPHRPTLERRSGAWLRDLHAASTRPGFTLAGHLAEMAERE